MHPYAPFVHLVEKPARYLGGEFNAVVKAWDAVDCRFILGFPDLYDIGMSHLGTKILYSIVNKEQDLLMERVFCPWIDMEQELRGRGLPLLSLETHRPLSAFDVVGFSLQYEMTFTNVLTMLELGGVPLRAVDRGSADPIVLGGGPTATHPEPLAPFFDAFLIGDAEERLPALLRLAGAMRRAGASRHDILRAMASGGGVYAPALYAREVDPHTGLRAVSMPLFPDVPARVERAFVADISRYRFPDDAPVAAAEAIFDRMSVEIARGCTEGCRFCQAGMIYRPVRERDPEQVVETVLSALDKGGYDEASITSLSTADYSCVSPLIKTLMSSLRARRVSLGISSLRAYGLDEATLDEIATVKATGLTFAPEAGTQRMRDVINKNVSEEDILATCHRVFSRGWTKMKLYFILGLPTETDDDLEGIVAMGAQARAVGRQYHRDVSVTVSVSSHVPKPHTPFQWAAMDTIGLIEGKQRRLAERARAARLTFKRHDVRVSHLEGLLARGDDRFADLIEDVWRRGARFDGWDDQLQWGAWQEALAAFEARHGLDREAILGTLPIDARLPWDHIDVGLEDGFLAREYRKALSSRLSPPCGKPFRARVHHTNLADARADERRLVCYDCGIACDMTTMRTARIGFLERLGADLPVHPDGGPSRTQSAMDRHRRGLAPHDFEQGAPVRYRVRFTKLGPVSLESHLDLVRTIPRLLLRARLHPSYSRGFSPRPQMSFGPALGLGVRALAELVDVTLAGDDPSPTALLEALNAQCPTGMLITGVRRLEAGVPTLAALIDTLEYIVALPTAPEGTSAVSRAEIEERLAQAVAAEALPVRFHRKGVERTLDVWAVARAPAIIALGGLDLDGDSLPGGVALRFLQRHGDGATLKPHEVAAALTGCEVDARHVLRVGAWSAGGLPEGRDMQGELVDPLRVGVGGAQDDTELATAGLAHARWLRERAERARRSGRARGTELEESA